MKKVTPDSPATIYVLFDPRNQKVPKYVGITTASLANRLSRHICHARLYNSTPLQKWIIALGEAGFTPSISVLEKTTWGLGIERERHWIRFYRPIGALLNISDGQGRLGMGKKTTNPPNRFCTRLGKTRSQLEEQKRLAHPRTQESLKKIVASALSRSKPIFICEIGKTYPSIHEAARQLNLHPDSISRAARSGIRVRGLTPKFI